jgi:sugar phosphate isomerase/epimerase
MKLGVICDGISRDLAHTVDVMDEFGLEYAELQFVGDTEVGDHSDAEIREIDTLLRDRGKPVSCLSRHIFAGMTVANKAGDELHTRHMDALKRVVSMAHTVGSPLVRIMTPKKEQILFGAHGAEKWNVAHGAWDAILPLIAPAVDVARDAGVILAVETGNGTMVNSNYTGRKLIDDLDAKDALKVLWDPANNCWCHERAFPDGYAEVKDGYLGHVISRMCRLIRRVQRLKCVRWARGSLLISLLPWRMRCVMTAMTVLSALNRSTIRAMGILKLVSG